MDGIATGRPGSRQSRVALFCVKLCPCSWFPAFGASPRTGFAVPQPFAEGYLRCHRRRPVPQSRTAASFILSQLQSPGAAAATMAACLPCFNPPSAAAAAAVLPPRSSASAHASLAAAASKLRRRVPNPAAGFPRRGGAFQSRPRARGGAAQQRMGWACLVQGAPLVDPHPQTREFPQRLVGRRGGRAHGLGLPRPPRQGKTPPPPIPRLPPTRPPPRFLLAGGPVPPGIGRTGLTAAGASSPDAGGSGPVPGRVAGPTGCLRQLV